MDSIYAHIWAVETEIAGALQGDRIKLWLQNWSVAAYGGRCSMHASPAAAGCALWLCWKSWVWQRLTHSVDWLAVVRQVRAQKATAWVYLIACWAAHAATQDEAPLGA